MSGAEVILIDERLLNLQAYGFMALRVTASSCAEKGAWRALSRENT